MTKIPQEGGTITVDVRYNTEFTVEIESAAQSWISFAGTKSLSSGKLTFEVKANESMDPRSGKVTVKDKSGKVQPQTLTFEQEAKKWVDVTSVSLNQTTAELETGQSLTLTATEGKGINLVFMGDAYTDKDIASNLYGSTMQQAMEAFFAIEPYKTFRNRFNVYMVNVVSKNGRTGGKNSTALGAVISNGVTISGSTDKCYDYALKVPGIKDKKNATVPQDYINDSNRLYKAYGWHANIDFTNDPKKVKLSDFLSDSRYKDEVGVYEGAANYTKGGYRPSANSMMNQNVEYFNAPSRWAIYQRILKLSGETPSFDKFLEYDAVNR